MFPFISGYDPPGSSEGSLDPLGLHQVADQLAVQLVPAVRGRMQRIRFLAAMAVRTLATEEIEDEEPDGPASVMAARPTGRTADCLRGDGVGLFDQEWA